MSKWMRNFRLFGWRFWRAGGLVLLTGVFTFNPVWAAPALPETSARPPAWPVYNWEALVSGIDGDVNAIAIDRRNNDAYVGGDFSVLGSIARWNLATRTWSVLDTGVEGRVYAIAVDSAGMVYVGGSFSSAGGVIGTENIAQWNPATGDWAALAGGVTGSVAAIAVDESLGLVYVGGNFGAGAAIRDLAAWDGEQWTAVGASSNFNGEVFALASDNQGNLYVGGKCQIDGVDVYFGKWDGANWSVPGGGVGVNGIVRAVAIDSSGRVYVGGEFTAVSSLAANRIAVWSETALAWAALETGLNGTVYALAVDPSQNVVYVGGSFTQAGGLPANRLARWDGRRWTAAGSGANDTITASVVDQNNNLYVGGKFSAIGGKNILKLALARQVEARLSLPLALKDVLFYFEGPGEIEDNDVYTSANGPVRAGSVYTGNFNDEKDYFSVYLRAAGTLAVTVTHSSENVQLQLFYQDVGQRVKADTTGRHVDYTGAAGWYYIYLNAGGSPDGSAYTLQATY